MYDSPWKTRIAAPKQTGFSRWHGDEAAAARGHATTVRGSSPGSIPRGLQSCAPRKSSKRLSRLPTTSIVAACDEPGCAGESDVHKRYLLHVAKPQSIVTDAPAHRRRHPAGGRWRADMAVFSFCSRSPGPCWWHGGFRKAASRLSPPHSSSGGETSAKKPLNQRDLLSVLWTKACKMVSRCAKDLACLDVDFGAIRTSFMPRAHRVRQSPSSRIGFTHAAPTFPEVHRTRQHTARGTTFTPTFICQVPLGNHVPDRGRSTLSRSA